MKTMEEINKLKYDMLTLSNASRGYSNSKAANNMDRVEGELDRLEGAYTSYVLSDDLKDEYIINELHKLVWTVDDNELAELLEDRPADSYCSDASITWVYDYIYDAFYGCETLDEIDCKITSIFGHYGNNYIVKNDGQFYIIFEW